MLIWVFIVSNVQLPKYLQYLQLIYCNKSGEVFFRYIELHGIIVKRVIIIITM